MKQGFFWFQKNRRFCQKNCNLKNTSNLNDMEMQLTMTIWGIGGEDGLSVACREGRLFRNDDELEKLYVQGFRVHNYQVLEDKVDDFKLHQTKVKVILKK